MSALNKKKLEDLLWGAAEFLRGFYRFLYGERGDAAWHWYTELTQDFLALVLMDFHKGS